ncbi:LLM class flavin-dependent oxidoreductase [Goodfellowiella coeruleoviolacea]|uniref:Flavin-dependent oxidoreductase, luciferase family (Includes alkanesulfonate monooxygenase SsuD and methylene tetrahydromethanopterin reductase) n=1 Tax=Goodfellowiella coeruleoviolacea TaxID=334858 RepID=A0AAE3KCU8_9PSEU|nr:LLM class flavin-dependent oxidoreductase [Goodfellowiella coeruleoviolacea]MCP2163296.1 Flavin-dependent oxidoreductase, luciferase family (includes alkanesulfonate monooxygenase SsuD and methylene tetrahydromethanopterin reductase) [Goodfellowiella coeruleoviolacea]
MEFGLNFFPVFAPERKSARDYYREVIDLAERADRHGFEHVQTVEHYGSPYGGYSPDPVILLTALAARTERIRITTGAVIPAFAHPIKLAGRLAMLDHISDGRLDVGFGRGFLPDEFEWFGVPMEESRRRFDEGLLACQRLWSEEDVKFEGEFHRFGPITLLPRPLQQPHPPIFVASASSPESCAAAGAAGHNLQVVPTIVSHETLLEMLDAYRGAYRAAGSPAGGGRIQVKYTCYLADDRATALERGAVFEQNYIDQMAGAIASWASTTSSAYQGYEKLVDKVRKYDFARSLADHKVLAGTPAEVTEQLEWVRENCGADLTVSLQLNPGYLEHEHSVRALELFAAEVAPRFTA